MTWRQVLILAKNEYGLKNIVWYSKKDEYLAKCSYTQGVVYMNRYYLSDFREKVSTLFHELGHIHCFDNKLWKGYHPKKFTFSKKQNRLIVLTGLRAERWVDAWGHKEFKKHFPKLRYMKGYNTKHSLKSYREQYLSNFK